MRYDPSLPVVERRRLARLKFQASPKGRAATKIRRSVAAKELRLEIISAYGGACVCCGEKTYEFLQIDHVDGGGNQHKKKVGRGYRFLQWIKANGFPKTLQLLCSNCNYAKGFYGSCPHHRN